MHQKLPAVFLTFLLSSFMTLSLGIGCQKTMQPLGAKKRTLFSLEGYRCGTPEDQKKVLQSQLGHPNGRNCCLPGDTDGWYTSFYKTIDLHKWGLHLASRTFSVILSTIPRFMPFAKQKGRPLKILSSNQRQSFFMTEDTWEMATDSMASHFYASLEDIEFLLETGASPDTVVGQWFLVGKIQLDPVSLRVSRATTLQHVFLGDLKFSTRDFRLGSEITGGLPGDEALLFLPTSGPIPSGWLCHQPKTELGGESLLTLVFKEKTL